MSLFKGFELKKAPRCHFLFHDLIEEFLQLIKFLKGAPESPPFSNNFHCHFHSLSILNGFFQLHNRSLNILAILPVFPHSGGLFFIGLPNTISTVAPSHPTSQSTIPHSCKYTAIAIPKAMMP